MSDFKTIGNRIKYAAGVCGGGNKLARATNIARSTLEGWIKGNTEPKAGQIVAIAEESHLSPLWILTGEGEASAIRGMDGKIIAGQRISGTSGFSEHEETPEEDPFITDPAMVKIMATRRITPQMVEDAVKNLMVYSSQNKLNLNPDQFSKAASLICELGSSDGEVTMQTVEKLMKFKELG